MKCGVGYAISQLNDSSYNFWELQTFWITHDLSRSKKLTRKPVSIVYYDEIASFSLASLYQWFLVYSQSLCYGPESEAISTEETGKKAVNIVLIIR